MSNPPLPVRCIYRASNGNGYCVVARKVYFVDTSWTLHYLGTMQANKDTPVSMADNGITIVIVDGSMQGYKIDMESNEFDILFDPTESFTGADKVGYIDTFILWNYPGTNKFGSTLSNVIQTDPLYIAAKTVYPDPIMSFSINRREILLIGQVKTEIWFNAGNPLFPFALLPGSYFEHGTCAKYSVAASDVCTYFLGQDMEGQGIVFRIKGYKCERISNHGVEFAIRNMAARGTIADAIGYCHQQDGHVFYVLTFPTGDETWAFDEATQEWAQRAWVDENGNLHRDRSNCHAFLYGKNVVGDWENGTIYALDPKYYSDTVAGVEYPIAFIRSFPHISLGEVSEGIDGLNKAAVADGARLMFKSFRLDLECGNGELDTNGQPATVTLRWSDDRGKTWGTELLQSSGAPGEWLTQPAWQGLGIARDRVFEVSYSIKGEAALNGAWVDAMVLKS